jgi:hypothetical protein
LSYWPTETSKLSSSVIKPCLQTRLEARPFVTIK